MPHKRIPSKAAVKNFEMKKNKLHGEGARAAGMKRYMLKQDKSTKNK